MNFRCRSVGMSDFVLSVLSGLCLGFLPWVQPFLLFGGKRLQNEGKPLKKSLNLPLGIEAFATIDTLNAYVLEIFYGERYGMNGNLKNCPSCGKLFLAQPKQKLCADCFEKQREEEERIIRYVNAHPDVTTLDEIVGGTGAEPKEILRMIHDSRLLQADREIRYPCESCGTLITRGRYCAGCMRDFKAGADRIG